VAGEEIHEGTVLELDTLTAEILAGIGGQQEAYRKLQTVATLKLWKGRFSSLEAYLTETGIAAAARAAEGTDRVHLVEVLKAQGLNQKAVGALLGISQQRVSQIGRGSDGHEARNLTSQGPGTTAEQPGQPDLASNDHEIPENPAGDGHESREGRKSISHAPDTTAEQPGQPDVAYTAPVASNGGEAPGGEGDPDAVQDAEPGAAGPPARTPDGLDDSWPALRFRATRGKGSGPAEATVRHEPHHRDRGEHGVGDPGVNERQRGCGRVEGERSVALDVAPHGVRYR
jgi:hypothetical protein